MPFSSGEIPLLVEHTTYITYNQWWLMELSYGKAAVMITI
jgi:hypothetical protein